MKNLILIVLFTFCTGLFAQTNTQNWLKDYKEALKTSEKLNKPILVFVTDNSNGEDYSLLQNQVFNSEEFNKHASSFVFLKLDTSTDAYHKRLASHYTKSNAVPALVLIDKNGNTIENALTKINTETISGFMNFLKTKTKH